MPATPSGSKKATAKRKQCARSSPAHTPKKRDTEKVGNASEDPVMKALLSIQLSLSDLNGRIQVLESQPSPTSTICSAIPAAYSAAAAFEPSTADPSGTIPRRVGEFTTRTNHFDPLHDLIVSDITFQIQYFKIFLKHSKSDRECKGLPVIIARTNSVFCPFDSMSRYMSTRPQACPEEPLFITEGGKAISRSWFAARFRLVCQSCGLPPKQYTTHSFHIGGATTAAAVTSSHTLKALGRWSSDAYERYVRPEIKDIIEAQRAMASA
ncbi:hypothetical protein E1301_Tti005239 [Triplophysa tibetana]|uniref:Tyr recombinase domain-containing protein n=1 Tax=Triplophysa tibetana TaxID=1572043 RepID=A0A5A9PLU7_9TELE|nr:hypothetical protein E1301_Tti005239 [Triplophysa tibetana]